MTQKAKENERFPVNIALLTARYEAMVASGDIRDDAAQREVLKSLEELNRALARGQETVRLGRLFKKSGKISGAYIWGGVGRGKSMLMDLFFDHAPVEKKRHVHFHEFMQEVHGRIHELRKDGGRDNDGADPVVRLARRMAEETSLLCFDELQMTDVADATLVYRLFSGLFEDGVTIVSTSNHPPTTLYTGGVQKERFAKFIALIEEKMRVLPLVSPLDYRREQIKSLERRYFHPLGPEANDFIADVLSRLCANSHPTRDTLAVKGRRIPFTLYDEAIGRFTFHELCETALGAGDYLALAKRCDTLILTDIPKLPAEKRNEARRFVTLIDALYEQRVKLLCTAAVPPEQIYGEGDGSFEFARTVSRLAEMQSAEWG